MRLLLVISLAAAVPTFAVAQDRYSAGAPQAAGLRGSLPAATGTARPMRLLSWPGKAGPVHAAPAAAPVAAVPVRSVAPAQVRAPQPVMIALAPQPRPSAALPTSIYSQPAQAPLTGAALPALGPSTRQPVAARSAYAPAGGGVPVRNYSVHRAFGEKPDPIKMPAEFFAESGSTDLAEPPPPLPPRVNGTGLTPAQAKAAQARAAAARSASDGG